MGVSRKFNSETSYQKIPEFWQEHMKSENGKIICGMYGICMDGDGQYFPVMEHCRKRYRMWTQKYGASGCHPVRHISLQVIIILRCIQRYESQRNLDTDRKELLIRNVGWSGLEFLAFASETLVLSLLENIHGTFWAVWGRSASRDWWVFWDCGYDQCGVREWLKW